jgi:hypothetical protein
MCDVLLPPGVNPLAVIYIDQSISTCFKGTEDKTSPADGGLQWRPNQGNVPSFHPGTLF